MKAYESCQYDRKTFQCLNPFKTLEIFNPRLDNQLSRMLERRLITNSLKEWTLRALPPDITLAVTELALINIHSPLSMAQSPVQKSHSSVNYISQSLCQGMMI